MSKVKLENWYYCDECSCLACLVKSYHDKWEQKYGLKCMWCWKKDFDHKFILVENWKIVKDN